MKVRCINASKSKYITKENTYEVVGTKNNYYTIIDDTGVTRELKKARFQLVTQ